MMELVSFTHRMLSSIEQFVKSYCNNDCFNRSVGHVKAALEAINGFNLFGSGGTSGSIVYVDIDG